jgi:hypothetical protein
MLPIQLCNSMFCAPKNHGVQMQATINLYKFVNETLAPCYSRFLVQFHSRSLEHHMQYFSFNDLSHCVGGTMWKYVVVRPLVSTGWPIQEGTDLTQKEVTTLKETWFSFDHNCVRSLFGSQLFISSISHVLTMSVHSILQPVDASCWPTTHGGKKAT